MQPVAPFPTPDEQLDATTFAIAQQLGAGIGVGGRVRTRRGQGHLNGYPSMTDGQAPPLPQPQPPPEDEPVAQEPPPANDDATPSLDAAIALVTAQQADLAALIIAQQSTMQAEIIALKKETAFYKKLAGGVVIAIAVIFFGKAFLNSKERRL